MNGESNNDIVPVILSGGSGTRLWPISRYCRPKQFVPLNGKSNLSLLQETTKRIISFEKASAPIFVCNDEHRFLVAEQCKEIKVNPKEIILEPVGRNTAPAILSAALRIVEENQSANLLVLSSDHIISNEDQFHKAIVKARKYSSEGKLVLFGVIPDSPETGYGYIEVDENITSNKIDSKNIISFIEKPNLEDAKEFLKSGKFLWNSGIFMFKASTVIEEIKKYMPDIYKQVRKAYDNKKQDLDFIRLDKEEFKKCQNISIDNAIMEKTDLGNVIALESGWSDIGNWFSLWQNSELDENNNFTRGRVFSDRNQNCYLRSDNRLIVALGLKNTVVVETDDVVFVGDIQKSQDVKKVVEELRSKNVPESKSHSMVFRPWGHYKSMLKGHRWQVKLITVKPGESLSLQMHHHRAEHWIVVKGTADVEIDGLNKLLTENQSIHIPLGCKHRLSNPGKLTLELIEVQSGPYLDEDDILRFNDKYKRV